MRFVEAVSACIIHAVGVNPWTMHSQLRHSRSCQLFDNSGQTANVILVWMGRDDEVDIVIRYRFRMKSVNIGPVSAKPPSMTMTVCSLLEPD